MAVKLCTFGGDELACVGGSPEWSLPRPNVLPRPPSMTFDSRILVVVTRVNPLCNHSSNSIFKMSVLVLKKDVCTCLYVLYFN